MCVLILIAACLALANLRLVAFTLAAMSVVPETASRTRFAMAAPILGLILCAGSAWWTFKRRWLIAIACGAVAFAAIGLGYAIVYSIAFPAR